MNAYGSQYSELWGFELHTWQMLKNSLTWRGLYTTFLGGSQRFTTAIRCTAKVTKPMPTRTHARAHTHTAIHRFAHTAGVGDVS